MYCKFCNKLCKNKNSLAQHEIRCIQNPNKLSYFHKGQTAWNKGLTAKTDPRVKKGSETLKNTIKTLHNNCIKYSKGIAKTPEA